MMDKKNIGVVGYGVLGARLCDAITLREQKYGDVHLLGVAKPSFDYKARIAAEVKGFPLFYAGEKNNFAGTDLKDKVNGRFVDLASQCDLVFDCATAK